MADLPKRVALVYDRVNKWGGAERVLLALHELFPDAPLYTSVYNSETAQWAKIFPAVIPSFLQNFPGAKTNHEIYPWATPLAFEQFTFDDFDLVISIASADAKGIITKPNTMHICYCLTPTRYLWSHANEYGTANYGPLFDYLKRWDMLASRRPDAYIAISKTVQDRITSYYAQPSNVVYPPVDVDTFTGESTPGDYFLYVGRLVAYKRIQTLVEIFNELELPLKIIGSGRLENWVRRYAKSNIELLGFLQDAELARVYAAGRALLFWHEEDFGITPVEAMAAGLPVIGLNRGGVAETVIHNSTGLLIPDSKDLFKNAILNFDGTIFDRELIAKHAKKFSKLEFKTNFVKEVTVLWKKYKSTHMS